MNEMLLRLIEEAIEEQQGDPVAERRSTNVYEKKHKKDEGFDYEPCSIYFTYVGFDPMRSKLVVDHYFYPRDGEHDKPGQGWDAIPYQGYHQP